MTYRIKQSNRQLGFNLVPKIKLEFLRKFYKYLPCHNIVIQNSQWELEIVNWELSQKANTKSHALNYLNIIHKYLLKFHARLKSNKCKFQNHFIRNIE